MLNKLNWENVEDCQHSMTEFGKLQLDSSVFKYDKNMIRERNSGWIWRFEFFFSFEDPTLPINQRSIPIATSTTFTRTTVWLWLNRFVLLTFDLKLCFTVVKEKQSVASSAWILTNLCEILVQRELLLVTLLQTIIF